VIVVDTNVISYLLAEDPRTDAVNRVLARDPHWVAPALWRSELRNALVTRCRAGALAWEHASVVMRKAERRMRDVAHAVPSAAIFAFARRSGCTAYHSEFGALAEALNVWLVTVDRDLLAAIPERAVTPEAFVTLK
jgi:predicted nucleic acid-binding protein